MSQSNEQQNSVKVVTCIIEDKTYINKNYPKACLKRWALNCLTGTSRTQSGGNRLKCTILTSLQPGAKNRRNALLGGFQGLSGYLKSMILFCSAHTHGQYFSATHWFPTLRWHWSNKKCEGEINVPTVGTLFSYNIPIIIKDPQRMGHHL